MRDLRSPLDGFLSPFGAVRGRVFSPLSLFASGEAGAWYDPSDLSTLYQTSTGATPVTAAGQPVGLVLDKSQGAPALGAELVTNGGFDADTDWTKGTAWVISGGVASNDGSGGFTNISQDVGAVAGKSYQVTLTVTGTLHDIRLGGLTGGFSIKGGVTLTAGTYTFIGRNPAGGSALIYFVAQATVAGTIDNISVRELPGNHLTQATAAARPVYQTGPDRLDHDGIDDVMNVTLPDLGTDATVASVAGGTVTYLEAQTISGSYAAPTSDWAGLVIIDRALTADEKAALEGIWT